MNIIKTVITEFIFRTKRVLNDKRAEAKLSELPPYKAVKIVISGTTYLVSSFFKNEGRGNVVDKISRLIEREVENISNKPSEK